MQLSFQESKIITFEKKDNNSNLVVMCCDFVFFNSAYTFFIPFSLYHCNALVYENKES